MLIHTGVLATPRISGISMDVAVPEDTGQDPALEVEQCACPPGYRGPSCQVSLGAAHLSSQPPPGQCSPAPPPLALPPPHAHPGHQAVPTQSGP